MAIQPITDKQQNDFDALTSGQYDNFALVSTEFNGEPTVVIATISRDDFGNYMIQPLYVALTDPMFDQLADPHEGL